MELQNAAGAAVLDDLRSVAENCGRFSECDILTCQRESLSTTPSPAGFSALPA